MIPLFASGAVPILCVVCVSFDFLHLYSTVLCVCVSFEFFHLHSTFKSDSDWSPLTHVIADELA